ncbi:MAG: hypothetical protein OXC91_02700 [Rhodobacteraceae bacterium]|nr:hypothetical protein [Paracoccaceae bacterium]
MTRKQLMQDMVELVNSIVALQGDLLLKEEDEDAMAIASDAERLHMLMEGWGDASAN